MKINITIHPYELNGYTNISPLSGSNIWNLSVDDSECTEIIAEDIIDFIPIEEVNNVINHYVSKLRHGGKIVLGGTDIIEVCKSALNQTLDISKTNIELYGTEEDHGWGFKRCCTSLIHISSLLEQLGLKVTKRRLENTKYIVEAWRE